MHTHELSKRGENCKWRLELRAHQMAIEAARASNGRVQFMISRIFVLDLKRMLSNRYISRCGYISFILNRTEYKRVEMKYLVTVFKIYGNNGK